MANNPPIQGFPMKVLYINPLFHTAIKAEQIPLKEVVKYENLQKYFSYDDINAMELETYLIVNSSALKRYELQSILKIELIPHQHNVVLMVCINLYL